MPTLLHLEPQPRFPYDDLTDDNAELLGLLLGNAEWVASGHLAAENARPVFRIGHQSIIRASHRLDYDDSQGVAFDKGISMFEAMSAMVNPTPPGTSAFKMSDISGALTAVYDAEEVRQYFMDAYDCFRHENPLAAEVVRTASRLSAAMAERAVLAAAISRHFEIDTSDAA